MDGVFLEPIRPTPGPDMYLMYCGRSLLRGPLHQGAGISRQAELSDKKRHDGGCMKPLSGSFTLPGVSVL